MPDTPSNSLVDGATGLHLVPPCSIYLKVGFFLLLLVEIILLLDYSRVVDVGVRDADDEDGSGCVVYEINSF